MNEPVPSTSAPLKKRVLPSRSRRGGPGVGNCDADILILETSRRQWENEPLIPKDTQFFLSTTLALAPPESPAPSQKINSRGYERYFERPEVIKAYQEQQLIETPEYWSTVDDQGDPGANIQMSRFRPRIDESQAVDTSDEAYHQRHRKYEKFEKRQRLREKEKLQHEQYKLHERVEQLRVMDYSAFLALPASNFSTPPAQLQIDDANGSSLLNGSAIAEGERRRSEMLAVAESLEARYRTLLPPRPWKKPVPGSIDGENDSDSSAQVSKQLPTPDEDEAQVEEPEDKLPPPPPKPLQQPSLKLKLTLSKPPSAIFANKHPRPAKKDKKGKKDGLLDPHHPSTPRVISSIPPPVAAPSPMHPEIAVLSADDVDRSVETQLSATTLIRPSKSAVKRKSRSFKTASFSPHPILFEHPSEARSETPANAEIDELASPPPEPYPLSGPPPKKRKKLAVYDRATSLSVVQYGHTSDSPAPPIESISAPIVSSRRATARPLNKVCGLVDAAQKHEKNKSGRRPRHNLAWGFRVPTEIFEVDLDFELPLWLLHDEAFQLRYSKYVDFEEDAKYAQQMNPLFIPDPRFVKGQRLATPESERLARALNSSHREHGEDSQSESEDEDEQHGAENLPGRVVESERLSVAENHEIEAGNQEPVIETEQQTTVDRDGEQNMIDNDLLGVEMDEQDVVETQSEEGIVAYEDDQGLEDQEMAMKVDAKEDDKDVESEDEL
ncbi:hypothetical protein D9757_004694 [Collybiopsis confluens]|uniref:PEHE domain-containing protein n=1 Tax=Collybiopsis confluens TaxID=2823264 RepID=A0A8H5HS65_9AGAR|nr:hypothetical protein D9757_004694 [Collybiopsis confluens]